MLARFVRFLIGLPLLAALIGFIMLNRGDTRLVYSPFHDAVTLPVMWLGLLFLCIGFISGVILLWAEYGSVRRSNRELKREVKTLEKQLSASMLPKDEGVEE